MRYDLFALESRNKVKAKISNSEFVNMVKENRFVVFPEPLSNHNYFFCLPNKIYVTAILDINNSLLWFKNEVFKLTDKEMFIVKSNLKSFTFDKPGLIN